MKPLILIVEDDTEIGSLLKKILKCQGYEILYLFLQNPEKYIPEKTFMNWSGKTAITDRITR